MAEMLARIRPPATLLPTFILFFGSLSVGADVTSTRDRGDVISNGSGFEIADSGFRKRQAHSQRRDHEHPLVLPQFAQR